MCRLLPLAVAAVLAAPVSADQPKLAALIELNRLKTSLDQEFDRNQATAAAIVDPLARRKFWNDFTARHTPSYQQAIKIAEQDISDKTAVDALMWIVVGPLNYTTESGPVIDRAIELLKEHHIKDPRMAILCQAISRFEVQSAAVSALIRTVIEKSPAPKTRGVATIRLADMLAEQARVAEILKSPEMTQDKELWSAILLPERRKTFDEINVAEYRKEAEKLWEKSAADFPDVKLIGDVTIGDSARGRLFKRRELIPGKPLPDLTGHTLDGKPIDLRDYRGKVVVLTFWAAWSPPSLALATKQRELLERLAGKPFAEIGVASDYDLESAQTAVERSNLPWVSIFDGNAGRGKIAIKWGISAWPTILVIDARGTIRHVLDSDDKLEKLVDELLAEIK